jgi:thiosulfate/3-mercaptopyruvate sulfurtransferase
MCSQAAGTLADFDLHVRTVYMTTDASAALISVRELADLIDTDARPVLLDVRWQVGLPPLRSEYLASHIPGAQWCDLDADLADPPGAGGRHPLPDPERLQRRMREWGIDQDCTVVVYDSAASVAASRGWWVLRWAGLTNVRVLDGGFAAWVGADLPTQGDVSAVTPGKVLVRAGSLPALSPEQVSDLAATGRLIDVRAPERYRGEVEPMDPVAGRIPGALNLPTTETVASDGTFRPLVDLRHRFAEAGIHGDGEPVGVYCGSGVTAAQTMLALHLSGVPAVLYPGSWSEWITDPNRPIATG